MGDSTHILHELLADRANVARQCGAEHKDLLLCGSLLKDLLDIRAHVWVLGEKGARYRSNNKYDELMPA